VWLGVQSAAPMIVAFRMVMGNKGEGPDLMTTPELHAVTPSSAVSGSDSDW
jgi:hypothetical protein